MGLGLGLNTGQQMANKVNQNIQQNEQISNADDIKEKFSKLKTLFDSGLINEKEYETKKTDLLNNL